MIQFDLSFFHFCRQARADVTVPFWIAATRVAKFQIFYTNQIFQTQFYPQRKCVSCNKSSTQVAWNWGKCWKFYHINLVCRQSSIKVGRINITNYLRLQSCLITHTFYLNLPRCLHRCICHIYVTFRNSGSEPFVVVFLSKLSRTPLRQCKQHRYCSNCQIYLDVANTFWNNKVHDRLY